LKHAYSQTLNAFFGPFNASPAVVCSTLIVISTSRTHRFQSVPSP